MKCANTEALNRYQNSLELQEKCFESFLDAIDNNLCEIKDMIEKVRSLSKDFDGYNFEDEFKMLVKDLI